MYGFLNSSNFPFDCCKHQCTLNDQLNPQFFYDRQIIIGNHLFLSSQTHYTIIYRQIFVVFKVFHVQMTSATLLQHRYHNQFLSKQDSFKHNILTAQNTTIRSIDVNNSTFENGAETTYVKLCCHCHDAYTNPYQLFSKVPKTDAKMLQYILSRVWFPTQY